MNSLGLEYTYMAIILSSIPDVSKDTYLFVDYNLYFVEVLYITSSPL